MSTRRWIEYVMGTPVGEFDLTLSVEDDGSFEWCQYHHSYDFGVYAYARGRWEQRGKELHLHVAETEIEHQWPKDKTLVGSIEDDGTLVIAATRNQLSPVSAKD